MDDILSDGIVGQERAIKILTQILKSNRIPNAILFIGKEGIGRHKLALNFLKALNSQIPAERKEKAFRSIENFSEPYVKFILPLPRGKGETTEDSPLDKLSPTQIEEIRTQISLKAENPYHKITIKDANSIKINSIRDIRKTISMNLLPDEYRAIIISDAHLMTTESQNALLKSLEEPPEKNIFILITDSPNRLLETIRSRCWTVELKPLSEKEIGKILREKFDVSEEIAKVLAVLSDGSVTKALEFTNYDLDDLFDSAITILRYAMGKKYFTAMNTLENVMANYDSNAFLTLMNLILKWIEDANKYKYLEQITYFQKHSETIERFVSRFADVDVFPVVRRIDQLIKYLDNNVYLNVITMNIIFELSNLINRNKVNVSYKYSLS